ncbi:Exodeoxyribonuclease I subunit D [Bradyrhizobium erythrophlei]|nr:Exodeoxyribonuclease I subunit D [Bradyrhizobium erythrophlei]
MKILHTADWHIGQTLNGWSRESEHRAFLGKLPELVQSQQADALIVAGDVFDGVNPSAESMRLLYDALAVLHASRPRLQTVLIAGNHDPAGRLEAPYALFEAIGVRVVGVIHREKEGPLDMARHLVPLRDATGEVQAHVLAIPYLRAGDLPIIAQDSEESGSPVVKATRRLYVEAINAARRRSGNKPLVVTGHLHCSGAIESEGAERRILVGGEHAVPPDIFANDIAYVALGHLHKPQSVGRETVRYSGSPFPMSATEIPYDHGVNLVDLQPTGTRSEHVPLGRVVQCLRMPAAGSLTVEEVPDAIAALRLDAECPTHLRPFVHVVVRPDGSAAGLAGEVDRALHEHPIRCAGVKIERPSRPEGEVGPILAKSLVECDPSELFEAAFTTLHGFVPNPQHRVAFESIRSGE